MPCVIQTLKGPQSQCHALMLSPSYSGGVDIPEKRLSAVADARGVWGLKPLLPKCSQVPIIM